jgi:hypothetical protein
MTVVAFGGVVFGLRRRIGMWGPSPGERAREGRRRATSGARDDSPTGRVTSGRVDDYRGCRDGGRAVDDLGDVSDAADAAEAAGLADLPSLEELGYDLDALEDVEALPFDVPDPFDDADPLTVPVTTILWTPDVVYSNATEVEWDPAAFDGYGDPLADAVV